MPAPSTSPPKAPRGPRLRVSPNYALAFTMDGHPYVAKEVEPYTHFWLTETERTLLSLFSGRSGATVAAALAAHDRLTGRPGGPRRTARLTKIIEEMRAAGVLVSPAEDTSRYDAAMADDYLTHRPIVRPVLDHIVAQGQVGPGRRILDLAGGPGNLALPLAGTGAPVTLMDLSRGFVTAAAERARRDGLPLTALHESCNRLAFHDETYDVVTISQALHWLDDVAVCKGLCRILNDGGDLFVIHCNLDLPPDHPLAYVLGDQSVLGAKARQPFPDQVRALDRRISLLFEALDTPDVERIDPASSPAGSQRIRPQGVALFREPRPIGEGFARAFLTSHHIASLNVEPAAFWADLGERCGRATPEQLMGVQDWAVLRYHRGETTARPARVAA